MSRGCKRFSLNVPTGVMMTRNTAPAAEIAYYHYYFVPLVLIFGLIVYSIVPRMPPPRWSIVFLESYLICHVGVFIGCHRWASHQAFIATTSLKWFLSLLAAWCMQGTFAHWAFLHRLHHRFCDQMPLDLQAPRAPSWVGYGHYSWFTMPVEHFYLSSHTNAEVIIPDLLHDTELPRFAKEVVPAVQAHLCILGVISFSYFCVESCCRHRERTEISRIFKEIINNFGLSS